MYNRNINRLTAVIQSPIAPRSTNVLWDDLVSNTLKVYRKGIWTVIGGAGGGGEGSSLYWGYDDQAGVIFPLDNRSVQINGDLTVNGDITARKLSVAELEIDGKPFEQYWELDTNTNTLSTTYQVLIKNNLIVDQDTSSGGDGQDTPASGIRGIYVNDVPYTDDDGDGFIDLGTISGGGGSTDLSNYYTKSETDAIIDDTFKSRSQISSNTNADQLLTNGVYLNATGNGSGNENIPVSYSILTTFTQSNNYAAQLSIGNGAFHFRRKIDTWSDWAEVIHSGNIGSYNAGGAKKLTPYNGICDYAAGISTMSFFTDWGLTNTLGSYLYGISMESPDASYKVQVGHALWKGLYWRDMDAGTWTSWKKIVTENADGNVLIGTTADNSAKLQVNGNIDSFSDGEYSGVIGFNRKSAVGGLYNTAYAGWQIHNYLGTLVFFCEPASGSDGMRMVINESGNVGIGTTELYDANKLRLVNTHPHQHTWSLGYLAQESDLSVEFKDTLGGGVYGLYTSINYYTGYVAMQVGRSDGLTNAYGLMLQPLGGNVLIGTAIDSDYKLDVNGQVRAEYYNLHNGAYITQQFGFLCLQSVANELCIGANGYNDIHINYRPSADGTAPKTYYWRAGSATSWADFYMGNTYIQGNLVVSGDVASA